MPSLILTGHACTGKTTFATLLSERAKKHKSNLIQNTIIINEQTARPDKTLHECYISSTEEKLTRSALKSEFDKYVMTGDKKTLIILDSLNYIKGFRYELHCISKAAGEKHGVIWLLCGEDVAKMWNEQRRRKRGSGSGSESNSNSNSNSGSSNSGDDNDTEKEDYFYTEEMMDELMRRYEPPDQRNRWDRPLYRVDVHSTLEGAVLDDAAKMSMSKDIRMQRRGKGNNSNDNNRLNGSNDGGNGNGNGNDGGDETSRTAEKILNKSVYNMHSLSDAIKDSSQSTTVTSSGKIGVSSSSSSVSAPLASAPLTSAPLVSASSASASAPLSSLLAPSASITSTSSASSSSSFRRATTKPKSTLGSGFRRANTNTAKNNNNNSPNEANTKTNISTSTNVSEQNRDGGEGTIQVTKKDKDSTSVTTSTSTNTNTNTNERQIKKMEDIADAILDSFLLNVEPLKEGQSTKIHYNAATNVLNDVDSISHDVGTALLKAQQGSSSSISVSASGGKVLVPIVESGTGKGKTVTFPVQVNKTVSVMEMKRLRRQYVRWVKDHPPKDTSHVGIAISFLSFLENNL